jgi:ubiquinone/menaquinone biosynthesis C-methylase UbiE
MARGVEPGWRCLEVGAGGGSVAEWLCGVVGGEGSVLATDLDATVLQALRHPNLEVRAHDLLIDELPARTFDLVHARLLLAWLSDPEVGLRRMLGVVKPAGCLVVEEMDSCRLCPIHGLTQRHRACSREPWIPTIRYWRSGTVSIRSVGVASPAICPKRASST